MWLAWSKWRDVGLTLWLPGATGLPKSGGSIESYESTDELSQGDRKAKNLMSKRQLGERPHHSDQVQFNVLPRGQDVHCRRR